MHGMSLLALGESLDVCLELNHCYENCGLVRDLNSGPLTPKARIIPLDQRASAGSWASWNALPINVLSLGFDIFTYSNDPRYNQKTGLF